MKLVQLDSKRKQEDNINHDAIELLESIVTRVKSGELTNIGIAWVDKDGSIGGDVSSGDTNINMWASLEHLARQFHNDLMDMNT